MTLFVVVFFLFFFEFQGDGIPLFTMRLLLYMCPNKSLGNSYETVNRNRKKGILFFTGIGIGNSPAEIFVDKGREYKRRSVEHY